MEFEQRGIQLGPYLLDVYCGRTLS